ncbi:tRNA-dihydrouridine(20a/20b) synthase [NAD(P)+] [Nakaseomyces bracarensis]|uniref:tRNA-dihydrouridine synthase n=1 Tax=Nakaseomyces bracarensis TaxID=273131 RepID=A0ABR4NYZ1_9SACH
MTAIPPPRKLGSNDPLHIIKTRKLTHGRPVTIAGPMVRYSKLPFRQTCRMYDTDIVYTPMILAREFVRNQQARMTDITTNTSDSPLIVQVGVNNVGDLMKFVEMVAPFTDGIGINCGCPIREQIREGIGCALIYNPDLLCDMVKSVKQKYGDTLRLETKIRIHDDLDTTVDLCLKLCDSGVDWITIHGRTRTTRSSQPANIEAIKYIVQKIKHKNVPVVANGDCFDMEDFKRISEETGVDGVMAVRGVLANPALFAGYRVCPWSCVEWFWYWTLEFGGLPFALAQHHLYCMLENMRIKRKLIKQMMLQRSYPELLDWFDAHFELKRHGDDAFATAIEPPLKEEH